MQPTSSPVKVGVIGIGNMGWHHARVLSLLKDANLIGVADPNEERGKLAIEQFQCEWFKDYKDLIPKVDAISIAVPTLLHQKVGLDCLKGGTNVLIEKPIAANELEAKSLIEESYWCQLNQLPKQEWAEYFDGPTGTWVGQQSRTYQTWTIVGFLLMNHFLRNEYNDLDMFKI